MWPKMPIRLTGLWRAKTRFEALTGCFLVGSGCAPVLVDQSAEDSVASDRGVEGDRGVCCTGGGQDPGRL
jgi:hypothetical protein